ncbi:MAG: NADH-quinone oxidoreductase subunit NuoG, partial [Burkholderiales bacterium]
MVKLEVDGKSVEVAPGTMVMEAAGRIGQFVPHFCYHKKLSIAANCRMCLVEIERAPKPMPACATPVSEGMKVWTHSERAKQAQNGVMEFLLINHPLDCPICDQGGECQLQDLAVGYGGSGSRFEEDKRVVASKDVGPLVAAEEMSRCIQCTRCVRFGQEVAGVMELGMVGRGEHAEIMAFVGKSVDSELSGNMIDVCPVGALTSKPFRYTARTWELTRRRSISPHDSLGSNLIVQVKGGKVMRVVPQENESLNECWLSDKDRFSYEGLNAETRLTKPMVRESDGWREVDWDTALERVVAGLKQAVIKHGATGLGFLGTPHSTFEELALLGKLARSLGTENVDFRLRHSDFSADGKRAGVPWLGMKVADIGTLDRVLVVGSFLRKDHPLLAQRIRQAAKRGQQVNLLALADDDLLINVKNKQIVAPSALVQAFAGIVKAAAEAKGVVVPQAVTNATVSVEAKAIGASLASGQAVGIFLGNAAEQHPAAAQLNLLAQLAAEVLGARFGVFGEAANSVGGYLAKAIPGAGGMNATAMFANPRGAYLLLNAEPELDAYDPQAARAALDRAEFVVALSAFQTSAVDYAHVFLPIAPFTETSGSFVNTEGRLQAFNAVVRPAGDARPGWKVLRVLASMLGLPGFEIDSSEQVREALGSADAIATLLDNRVSGVVLATDNRAPVLERIADVPIYSADAIVRRAASLQQTADAALPRARVAALTAQSLGMQSGQRVKVRQVRGEAVLELVID